MRLEIAQREITRDLHHPGDPKKFIFFPSGVFISRQSGPKFVKESLGVPMKTIKNQIVSVFLVIFTSTVAMAYEIEAVHYDEQNQLVQLDLIFSGGLQEHVFSTEFSECDRSTEPPQLAARISDTGWEDTGTDLIRQTVIIDLKPTNCVPSIFTLRIGNKHRTLNL